MSAAPTARSGPRSRWRRYSPREIALAAGFLAPAFAVFVVFAYWPFLRLLRWGMFQSIRGGAEFRPVGLSQYREVLTGSEFRDGLWHSFEFVLYTVPAGLVLGVLLAVAAHRRLKGIKAFQLIFSSTLATSSAVAAVIFLFLLHPAVGVIQTDWRSDPDLAMLAVALPAIWQNLGLSFIICLAGLQAIPDEVIEAATLDGFGPIRRLVRVTLPLLSPVLLFLGVVLVIFAFQNVATIDIVTQGGPAGRTETLIFKIARLTSPDDIGVGAVMSFGLFVVTFLVVFIQFLILERRVHYGS